MKTNYPNREELKEIFNIIHNVWLKKYWDAKTEDELTSMVNESNSILKKYPYNITKAMLVELSSIIGYGLRKEV